MRRSHRCQMPGVPIFGLASGPGNCACLHRDRRIYSCLALEGRGPGGWGFWQFQTACQRHDRGVGGLNEQNFTRRTCPAARVAYARRVATPGTRTAEAGVPLKSRPVGAGAGSAGSSRDPGGASQDPCSRSGASPVRPHGRIAILLFPRRSSADGMGSGTYADGRHPGAGLR